ncbi:hypothetical protein AGMMS50229_15950 [Campylobacterota bacterium]|nr:hypothetical protein AGMMS50229_15950 [Campylobacterota bacterium]
MYMLPAAIWNDIARTQELKTRWAKWIFLLDDSTLIAALEDHSRRIVSEGMPERTVMSYHEALPIYAEREAITSYIIQTQQPELRSAVPEVSDHKEAARIVAMEHRLENQQEQTVARLLEKADAEIMLAWYETMELFPLRREEEV